MEIEIESIINGPFTPGAGGLALAEIGHPGSILRGEADCETLVTIYSNSHRQPPPATAHHMAIIVHHLQIPIADPYFVGQGRYRRKSTKSVTLALALAVLLCWHQHLIEPGHSSFRHLTDSEFAPSNPRSEASSYPKRSSKTASCLISRLDVTLCLSRSQACVTLMTLTGP